MTMLASIKSLNIVKEMQSTDFLQSGFDKTKVILKTKEQPSWLHFGANNGCMLPSLLLQKLIEKGEANTGLILAETKHFSNFNHAFQPFHNNGICIKKTESSGIEASVISTITEILHADLFLYSSDWNRLVQIMTNPSLQIMSFSLGKDAYIIYNKQTGLLPAYEKDCKNGPLKAQTDLGKITALCLERYKAGEYPLALVSFDFFEKNGSFLNEALVRIAREWEQRGFVQSGFSNWLNEPEIITFPWTIITKNDGSATFYSDANCEFSKISSVEEHGSIPPFLCIDTTFSLLIEDDFPNGRLPLEDVGVMFYSRDAIFSLQ